MVVGDTVKILYATALARELEGTTGVIFDILEDDICPIAVLLHEPKGRYRVWQAKREELEVMVPVEKITFEEYLEILDSLQDNDEENHNEQA